MRLLILVTIALFLLLAACGPKPADQKGPNGKKDGMDSPITVSDGSPKTVLHHPSFQLKIEPNQDDGNRLAIHAHVNDSGFVAYKITCTSGCTVPNPQNLTAPWMVEVFDNVNAAGHRFSVIRSDDGTDIRTHFFRKPIDAEPDSGPTIPEIVQNDFAPRAAVLNGAPLPPTFKCDKANGSTVRCTFTIDYCNPAGTCP